MDAPLPELPESSLVEPPCVCVRAKKSALTSFLWMFAQSATSHSRLRYCWRRAMSAAFNLAQHFVFIESPPDLLLIHAPFGTFGTSGHKSETHHPSPHFRSTRLWLTSHSLPFRLSFIRIKPGRLENSNQDKRTKNLFESAFQ